MRSVRNIVVSILLLTVTGLASPGAFGAREQVQPSRWKAGPIKIYVSNSLVKYSANVKADTDVLAAVSASLKTWADSADVVFQIELTDKMSVSPQGVAGDGISLITIAATPENVLLFTKDAQKVAARTRTFSNRKGTITEADIVLNPFQQFSIDGSYGTLDLEAVLTHEIGHLLGLRHSEVLGSVMCDNLPRNGSDASNVVARRLGDSDIAAVRDLYGTADLMDDCCAVVTGRISQSDASVAKGLRIWAEDVADGRVVAQSEVGSDGDYRMGGISAGRYRILARSHDGATEEISTVTLEPLDQKTVNGTISVGERRLSIELVGVDGRLSEAAVTIARGTERLLYIGGRGVEPRGLVVTTNSPFFHIDSSTITKQNVKSAASVVSFSLKIDPETPHGVYSLFASSAPGDRSVLIGAIRVE